MDIQILLIYKDYIEFKPKTDITTLNILKNRI